MGGSIAHAIPVVPDITVAGPPELSQPGLQERQGEGVAETAGSVRKTGYQYREKAGAFSSPEGSDLRLETNKDIT